MGRPDTNLFCSLDDLGNEASVEQFFVSRLLADLGYKDSQIMPKESLENLAVHQGRKRLHYRPDYALKYRGQVRWVCDAKAANEALDDWVGQCASYCLELNRRARTNPVEFFVLTNGVATDVYRWDADEPVLQLDFEDFNSGNRKYEQLARLLGPSAFAASRPSSGSAEPELVTLHRKSASDLNLDFAWAHKYIYKRENLSYGSAFMEFVKVIFLKLLSDREVRKNPDAVVNADGSITVPASDVNFTTAWIESLEKVHPNPMDAVQFARLLKDLDTEIQKKQKKRIFSADEHIRLSNETIKAITKRFQFTDLYGIDSDLNGRMFETFLNATLRGKDLGQYFTPRSVAKLATRLADLRVGPDDPMIVLDACCGTGGFLIEALTDMWQSIDSDLSLSSTDRASKRDKIAQQSLFGIDVARDPALARIARINMYLHGDGGSRIYQLDSLDKLMRDLDTDDVELQGEKDEFRELLGEHPAGFADVVLTNPPFAKEYSRAQPPEKRLLDKYALAFDTSGARKRPLRSLRSSVMFLERYHDLLVPGGLLVSVIDDGILGGDSYAQTRSWLREHYLIRAVISLPGDAFQRSQARVKTSLLLMEKRKPSEEQEQPPVFMYYCTSVGIDDPPRQRVLPGDEQLRRNATGEIARVAELYRDFRAGGQKASQWVVPGDSIGNRMDVKAVLPTPGTQVPEWVGSGRTVVQMNSLIRPAFASLARANDVVPSDDPAYLEPRTHLRVRYDGFAEEGDEVDVSDSKPRRLYIVRKGDLVVSHINAINGAAAIVPDDLDGCAVTDEYTVCAASGAMDIRLVWALLRSPVARADLLLLSTGIGRTRIDWSHISQLKVPMPSASESASILATVMKAEKAEKAAREFRVSAQSQVLDDLQMDSAHAQSLLAAFKPPR